jgi:hypothetical protein
MHCLNILKDEPKWIELKRRMDDKPQSSFVRDASTQDLNSNTMLIDFDVSLLGVDLLLGARSSG